MAGLKRIKATKEFNFLVHELALASKDQLKEIPKILASMSETSADMVEAPKPEIIFPKDIEPLDLRNPEKIPEGTIIQNRDRSGVGSIAQMRKIASKPDYLRMSGMILLVKVLRLSHTAIFLILSSERFLKLICPTAQESKFKMPSLMSMKF